MRGRDGVGAGPERGQVFDGERGGVQDEAPNLLGVGGRQQ